MFTLKRKVAYPIIGAGLKTLTDWMYCQGSEVYSCQDRVSDYATIYYSKIY